MSLIAGTFNCYSPLVICITGRAPAPVCFVYTQNNSSISPDSIITGRFSTGTGKAAANRFCRKLSNYTMRSDSVNRMCPSSAVVWTFYRTIHQAAITHSNHPFVFHFFLRAAFNAAFRFIISLRLCFFGGLLFTSHTLIRVNNLLRCHFWHSNGMFKAIIQ